MSFDHCLALYRNIFLMVAHQLPVRALIVDSLDLEAGIMKLQRKRRNELSEGDQQGALVL